VTTAPASYHAPLLHAGRALFAAVTGDEARLRAELLLLYAQDIDGRHRRWAGDESTFAPFRQRPWFQDLLRPPGTAWAGLGEP
jgi:hypothetical protein